LSALQTACEKSLGGIDLHPTLNLNGYLHGAIVTIVCENASHTESDDNQHGGKEQSHDTPPFRWEGPA
jgi:hypothetical protein